MKGAPPTITGRTRRRWPWILAAGLLAHAALVFWLGERAKPVGVVSAPDPLLTWALDSNAVRPRMAWPRLGDPTLFALPSARGFSGRAWLLFSSSPPSTPAWTEPPRWLPLDTNELGGAFTRFVATNKYASPVMAELLQLPVTTADVLVMNDPVMTQSVVSVEGPLARRPWAVPLQVRNPAHPEALPATEVQIRVNRDGLPESVVLLKGCGAKNVDEQALSAARAARFRPLPSDDQNPPEPPALDWGKLIFHWFTVLRAD